MKPYKVTLPGNSDTMEIRATSHTEAAYHFFSKHPFDSIVIIDSEGLLGEKIVSVKDLAKVYPDIAKRVNHPKDISSRSGDDESIQLEFSCNGIYFWMKQNRMLIKFLLSIILLVFYIILEVNKVA